ncbi:uncharacterized protein LOC134264726 [Saccostrea cucullata]|uniref:uncharacterized protein LOC134264726 n=1 Tax=Saccostrea cuccullata TaxID=36930 RepID=UPI002ED213B7
MNFHHIKANLSKEEEKALRNLSTGPNIVIKEADKGGAVVIMNNHFYKSKIMDMLQDNNFHKQIHGNDDRQTMKKIKSLIHGPLCPDVTEKEKDYLVNFDFRESQFYGLPKMHKSAIIKEAIKNQNKEYIICPDPVDLSFRPIVGGPNAPTQRISQLLDILLKPLCKKVTSYVRDDLDFLNHLPSNVNKDAKLVTFDVVSLYTNIPTDLGIQAVKFWMEKYPDMINSRFQHDFILEGLKLVLNNNSFAFAENHYIQTKGTAMGTKVAPTYATLTLGYLETLLKSELVKEWGEEFADLIETNWKRFLDDCFIIWHGDMEKLTQFHKILNGLNSNIQFTLEMNDEKLPFLDVLVEKKNIRITTDIYYKATDTHQYLHFGSCHPNHTKSAIPYNLARRVCTIVSEENTRDLRLEELKSFLVKRKYPIRND